jgi:hypothetical protein
MIDLGRPSDHLTSDENERFGNQRRTALSGARYGSSRSPGQ